jgi:hypothetical protein
LGLGSEYGYIYTKNGKIINVDDDMDFGDNVLSYTGRILSGLKMFEVRKVPVYVIFNSWKDLYLIIRITRDG